MCENDDEKPAVGPAVAGTEGIDVLGWMAVAAVVGLPLRASEVGPASRAEKEEDRGEGRLGLAPNAPGLRPKNPADGDDDPTPATAGGP